MERISMSSLSAQLDTRPRCSQEQLGKFAVWRNDRETMRSQVFQELRQLSEGPSLPSPTRLATAYYALRLCQPKAGFPIIQMGYDDLFTVIDKVLAVTEENSDDARQLQTLKADYRRLLSDNLIMRSQEEYRCHSYYWLTLLDSLKGGDFLTALSQDAEKRTFRAHEQLQDVHHAPGFFSPKTEADHLIDIFLGMQLNPHRKYSFHQECIDIAKEQLPLLWEDDDSAKAQLATLLFLRTGDDRFRQQADDIISSWHASHLSSEQRFFLQYHRLSARDTKMTPHTSQVFTETLT